MCLAHLENLPCVRLASVNFCSMAVDMVYRSVATRIERGIIQNVARSTDVRCLSNAYKVEHCFPNFSTGNTNSADGAQCSFRSRIFFHKVFGLSSIKFSRTGIEQEGNMRKR